jgi:sugar phosphate isomerase/epimerase
MGKCALAAGWSDISRSNSLINRRQALLRTATRVGAAGLWTTLLSGLRANPLKMPIGCQTYPVRKMIESDFPGTIKQLADAGFERIELCSPVGYEKAGFGSVAKYKGPELRKLLGDMGLKCESAHFSMKELRENQADRIAWATDVGLKQMLVASLGGPKEPTLDDVKRAAEEYNKLGEQAAKAGIQQGLHNENFELSSIDGKRTYDLLFELLDPKLVKFQFQVSTISRGFDAAEYFTKYPGRFVSMHVQDWSNSEKKIVAVGKGDLDWTRIFKAAKMGGIKNYFVEMNLDMMKESVPFLKQLEV